MYLKLIAVDGWMGQNADIKDGASVKKQFISFVYAEDHEKDRKLLWKNLIEHNNIVNGSPWSLLGDFKVALNVEECSDSFSIKDKDMQDFRSCLECLDWRILRMFYT
ncbi:hypothetical protein Tco_0187178, partial [Tanacetum coccineum]